MSVIWSYIGQEVRKCSSVSTSFCRQCAHSLSSLESHVCLRRPLSIAMLCALSVSLCVSVSLYPSISVTLFLSLFILPHYQFRYKLLALSPPFITDRRYVSIWFNRSHFLTPVSISEHQRKVWITDICLSYISKAKITTCIPRALYPSYAH